MTLKKGLLYVTPTPIGNLQDITLRAIEVLKNADVVFCEDTRVTGRLYSLLGIKRNKFQSYHKYNERYIVEKFLPLDEKLVYALVSDSGTPCISDPGSIFVTACIQTSTPFEVLPGATAIIPAIVSSGFDTSAFSFLGFVPKKKGRKTFFTNLQKEEKTIILYESPYRVTRTLEDIKEYLGSERNVCVSKELSKMHETQVRGQMDEVMNALSNVSLKGEFVIIIGSKV